MSDSVAIIKLSIIDYQPYPSRPFGYSVEYAGNHLRGLMHCRKLAHNTLALMTVQVSFYMYVRFCFHALVWRKPYTAMNYQYWRVIFKGQE